MPAIEVRNLVKAFGPARAIDDISFTVEQGQILVIVGSSGCGKTTTLRCIAGLENPTAGSIAIDDQLVASAGSTVPPEKRGVGMVFQSYALWPHMTIFNNIAYGLVLKNFSRPAIAEAVGQAMELVGLSGMQDRFPNTLSGGQQQRVALARSLICQPKVLLLDEPLSNLDAKLRDQMRAEIRTLIKRLNMTAVHITHDQDEAMAIADKVIYMRGGRIEQMGTPRELYRSPVNRHVAEFVGTATFVDGTIVRQDSGCGVLVRLPSGIELWSQSAPASLSTSGKVTLAIRPESIVVTTAKPDGPNVLAGRIVDNVFVGSHTKYEIDVGELRLRCVAAEDFVPGEPVFLSIDPDSLICQAADAATPTLIT